MCSEVCSPRISFSYGMGQIESDSVMQIQQQQIEYDNPDSSRISDSGSDFEFISACFEYEISSADELFSNGMILPIQVQPKIAQNDPPKPTLINNNNNHNNNHKSQPLASSSSSSLPPLPYSNNNETAKKETIKEITISTLEPPEEKSITSKSFWGFKRSSSLNSERVQKRSLMCSFPLLARSYSTGSVPNKKTSQKQQQPSLALVKSSSSSSSSSSSIYSKKPPLKKGYGLHGSHHHGNNGVRVSPVLSVVPTHHLLGLGSFLRNGKDKKTRR